MKSCFKCERVLPRSEFYAHPQMGDGLLGKCKDCTKKDTADRIAKKQTDFDWVKSEAERCRKKQALRRSAGLDVFTPEENKVRLEKWQARHPQKVSAQRKVASALRTGALIKKPCVTCGEAESQAHHEDYSKPLDVIWFCVKHHMARHVEINDAKRRAKVEAARAKVATLVLN